MRDGWTALQYAAMNGYSQIVILLKQSGADINTLDKLDRNCWHWAARFNNHKMAQILLDLECDQNQMDIDNKTPQQIAFIYESKDVIDIFEGVA